MQQVSQGKNLSDFGYVKVAALSPRVTVADPAANAASALAAIESALAVGVQVIALPELYLSSYSCGDLFGQTALHDACETALLQILEETKDHAALIAIGMPVRALGRLWNCAAVLQSGRILGLVPKEFLPNTKEYYEKRWFTPFSGKNETVSFCGQETLLGRGLFATGSCTVGVEICEDVWVPAPPSAEMALRGAEVILNLSASDEEVAKQEYRRNMIAQQSGRLRCCYVYCSAGVGESSTDVLFSGACFVAENGKILAETRRFEQEGAAIYSCTDTALLRAERRTGPFGEAVLYGSTCTQILANPLPTLAESNLTRKYSPTPFVPGSPLLRAERCRDIFEIQSAALAKRLTHTGLRTMILGLSGGLDSTLALLVALRTATLLGWEHTQILAITMPGFGTSERTRQTVEELKAIFGFSLTEIDIRPACELHMRDIGHDPQCHDVTFENVQARERTQVLMDLANQTGALLLGTGDLSELALGFCTYNADHMSMYGVNCGVPKTLVRHLVAWCAEEEEPDAASVLERVLATPISPELLPPDASGNISQKTEDLLGNYDVHDFYLYYFFRFGFTPEKLFLIAKRAFSEKYSPKELKKWLILFLRRFFSQQFKRSCLPDGPRVGTVSLSPRGDWRQPSDASAALWLKQAEKLEI